MPRYLWVITVSSLLDRGIPRLSPVGVPGYVYGSVSLRGVRTGLGLVLLGGYPVAGGLFAARRGGGFILDRGVPRRRGRANGVAGYVSWPVALGGVRVKLLLVLLRGQAVTGYLLILRVGGIFVPDGGVARVVVVTTGSATLGVAGDVGWFIARGDEGVEGGLVLGRGYSVAGLPGDRRGGAGLKD